MGAESGLSEPNRREPAAAWRLPIGVSRETERRLTTFLDLLRRWSATLNLTGKAASDRLWHRHILDSLQLLPFLRDREPPFADLGAGAGFPGLVLAIASGCQFHLIEADQRKAAFLREAARITQAPVSVHPQRIEHVRLPAVSLVTARALAPLPRLLALARPFVSRHGVLLAMKGRTAREELTATHAEWKIQVVVVPSRTDPRGSILEISDIRPAA